MHGSIVCKACGLVLEDRILEVEPWRTPPPTGDLHWKQAMRRILQRLGHMDAAELARAFDRPPGWRQLGLRLDVLVAYYLYLQWGGCLSAEHARSVSGATRREWEHASDRCAALAQPRSLDDEERGFLARETRRRGLPDSFAEATLQALDEPQRECSEPKRVLVACVAESLGAEAAAHLFDVEQQLADAWRSRYSMRDFVPDLSIQATALQARVAVCRQGLAEQAAEAICPHLDRCSSCALAVERLGLGFLLRLEGRLRQDAYSKVRR